MEKLSDRIKDFPTEQFIDWLCLSCVDVRASHSDDCAQEDINKIREAVTVRLAALEDKLRIKQNHIRLRDSYIEELEERAESAEEKLAELDKQEPIYLRLTGTGFDGAESYLEFRTTDEETFLNLSLFKRLKLFAEAAAPAAVPVDLVPDEMHPDHPKMRWVGMDELFPKIEGWNDCRAEMLRRIEER